MRGLAGENLYATLKSPTILLVPHSRVRYPSSDPLKKYQCAGLHCYRCNCFVMHSSRHRTVLGKRSFQNSTSATHVAFQRGLSACSTRSSMDASGLQRRAATVLTLMALAAALSGYGETRAHAAALPAPAADNGGLMLPPGFHALIVADNLSTRTNRNPVRFLTVAPNGDIYGKCQTDGLIALRDTNSDGRADVIERFGSGPGTGIALRSNWLYFSTRTGVYRYPRLAGELVPKGEPQTIVSGLPAQRDHDAKSFAFDGDGRLLVEVGSPYNVYSQADRQRGATGMDATEFLKTHGGFWRFDPDKLGQTQADGYHFSTGHRHSLSLAWHPVSKEFFMVMMGRDQLNTVDPEHYDALDNAERIAEEMHLLRDGVNLGWPYTYYDPFKKARMVAPEFGGDNQKRDTTGKYDAPVIAFPAHWAPLQMTYYGGSQFPEKYRGGMFLAFHGSWNRAPLPQGGYRVVYIPFNSEGMPTGSYETFADGFSGQSEFGNTSQARCRPCGLAVGPDGSLYVGDTERGRIWRIFYTGETNSATQVVAAGLPAATEASAAARLYLQTCGICHMPDGNGVPGMQPALNGSAVVTGDVETLVRVVLKGPAQVLPADRPPYINEMPPFASAMTDRDIAAVLTYIRKTFGKDASPVTVEQVAAQRGQ